jgi:competence protein ComFC
VLASLLDALFPRRCAGCGSGPWPFCRRCHADIVVLGEPRCERCAAPSLRPVSGCRDCPPSSVAIARAPFAFDGPVRRAVHRLKFGGWRAVAEALAEAMARSWSSETWRTDVVTWVPLSRERLAVRGYDQARALALAVAPRIGISADALVRRVGDPGPQARRGGLTRREAMRGVFAPAKDVSGRVLLVDDVLTTGATAGACAEALLAGGASSVGLLTAARAVSSARRPRALYSASGSRPGLWLPRGAAPRQSMPAAGEATHVSRPLVGEHGAV